MENSRILAVGSYLPNKTLSNQDLEKIVSTTDEWIFSRSGIKSRHIVANDETTSSMSYMAALDVIKNANIDKNEIDLIIVATTTPDQVFPSVASMVQQKLNLSNTIPAFDLQAACTGFIYALTTADAFIKSGMAKKVLAIGADTMSRLVDYSDRNTCVLFGDGAGAVILEATSEIGIIQNELHADGSGESALKVSGHIYNGKIKGDPFMFMDGKAVFKMAVHNLASVATNVLAKSGYTSEQIDWLIPHQANIRIIKATAEHLSLPMSKVITTVENHGNTSAASVPLALDYAIKNNKVKRGHIILLEGVGAGFTWGASLIKY
jgi:3-oxoacyl-[acyl-carrier-protein] synthase III